MTFELTEDSFRKGIVTYFLIGINVLVFLIVNQILGDYYLYQLAQDNSEVIYNQEYWRIFTSIFAHANIAHLVSNMVFLFFIGISAEALFSRPLYLFIYLLSGVVGSIFTLIFNPINTVALGASGAIFGVLGAVFIAVPKQNKRILLFGLLYMVSYVVQSFAPGIGTWAHIFGLLTGLIIGGIWRYRNARIGFNPRRNY